MILYYLVMILAALFVLKGIYNWVHAAVLRISLYIRLRGVCKSRGYEMNMPRFIFASFVRYSSRPDVIIKTGGVDYLIRIITCRQRKRVYHFVSHEWYVRVFRYYLLSLAFHSGTPLVLSRRARRLPPLDESFLSGEGDVKKQMVLLFNPSPLEITFNSPREGGKKVAANGTDYDGWLIYNGKAFSKMLGEDGAEE